jgi:hypothetical protein
MDGWMDDGWYGWYGMENGWRWDKGGDGIGGRGSQCAW